MEVSGGTHIPIADYGLIGNGRTAALISRHGSLDWCCFPHFDSSSVFGAILDPERGGTFSIRPTGQYTSEQSYLPETNILATRFKTSQGEAVLQDCFPVQSEAAKTRELRPEHEILRRVQGVRGRMRFEIRYSPRPDYGQRGEPPLQYRPNFGLICGHGHPLLLLRSTVFDQAGGFVSVFEVGDGEIADFSLIYTNEGPAVVPPFGEYVDRRLSDTVQYWRSWASRCRYHGPHREHVVRSALALKLLLFAPSGAVVAAPTTSLPEKIGGSRNWDYRYCWIRDAAFTVRALVELGYHDEASAFVGWLLHSTRLTRPRLQVVYSPYGHTLLREKNLPALSGYRGSRPVRIGNAAARQFQLDVYGELLDAVHVFSPYMEAIDGETRRFILGLGKAVEKLWRLPDEGIWEVRSDRGHHTHSKVMSWVAFDRLIQIGTHFGWNAPYDRWKGLAQEIRREVEDRGFNPRIGSYTRLYGGDEIDASLLMLPIVGFCDAHGPRMRSTCSAIQRSLQQNGLIYRYRNIDDGIGEGEGAFGICNFWMAEVLARMGRMGEAEAWLGSLLKRSHSTGLWSEEIDPESGEFLGNYPQAFTHVGLINAVVTLQKLNLERERAA